MRGYKKKITLNAREILIYDRLLLGLATHFVTNCQLGDNYFFVKMLQRFLDGVNKHVMYRSRKMAHTLGE